MSGKYIVVFKPTASEEKINEFKAVVRDEGGEVGQTYDLMKGFSATLAEATVTKFTNSLQEDPDSPLDFIEPDSTVTTQ